MTTLLFPGLLSCGICSCPKTRPLGSKQAKRTPSGAALRESPSHRFCYHTSHTPSTLPLPRELESLFNDFSMPLLPASPSSPALAAMTSFFSVPPCFGNSLISHFCTPAK